jgi:septal ring factor EnvC (AmiA/AmiB activator)
MKENKFFERMNKISGKSKTRRCIRCGEYKIMSEFAKSDTNQAYVTGVSSTCLDCKPKVEAKKKKSKDERRILSIQKEIDKKMSLIEKHTNDIEKLREELNTLTSKDTTLLGDVIAKKISERKNRLTNDNPKKTVKEKLEEVRRILGKD